MPLDKLVGDGYLVPMGAQKSKRAQLQEVAEVAESPAGSPAEVVKLELLLADAQAEIARMRKDSFLRDRSRSLTPVRTPRRKLNFDWSSDDGSTL